MGLLFPSRYTRLRWQSRRSVSHNGFDPAVRRSLRCRDEGPRNTRTCNVDREFLSRRAGRFIPSTSVTVALVEETLPIAYGVVRDISEAGACIMTDSRLSPDRTYQFRMSFFGGQILEAMARVVWRENGREIARRSEGVPNGVEFIEIQRAHLDRLRLILQSAAFAAKNTH